MRLLCVLVSVAYVASLQAIPPSLQAIPPTMTAAYKAGILPCKTPFTCVKTHSIRTPAPGEGEVLVAVAASSVNPCDVDYLEFGVGCSGGAGTLGMDMAGTVVAVGGGCSRLKVGDRVWGDIGANAKSAKGPTKELGGYAQYAVALEAQLATIPPILGFAEAGSLPERRRELR